MKVLISNKHLLYENFILIKDRFDHSVDLKANEPKGYRYLICKKEKRYTLKNNNPHKMTVPDELFFWPYKNLSIYANKTFGLKII